MARTPRPFRVLVVDDDEAVLASTEALLDEHAEVVTATSATRALRLLGEQTFHVVCSDFAMPGGNGLEVLRVAAKLPGHVGCLLLTGSREYAREDHAPYYVLLKPFDPERLIGLVLQLARLADMKRSVSTLTRDTRVSPFVPPAPPSSRSAIAVGARRGSR